MSTTPPPQPYGCLIEDVWLTIIDHLPTYEMIVHDANAYAVKQSLNVRTLASLCRLNSSLGPSARKALYHTFVKPESVVLSYRSRSNTLLRRFLRTLLTNAHLRPLVQTVIINQWQIFDEYAQMDCWLPDMRGPEAGLYKLYLEATSTYHFDSFVIQAGWEHSLSSGSEDAEIALLLTLVPNLKHLAMELPTRWEDCQGSLLLPYFMTLINETRNPMYDESNPLVYFLSNLERFTSIVSLGFGRPGIPRFEHISTILQLPSMKTLDGMILSYDKDRVGTVEEMDDSNAFGSSVQSVTLYGSGFCRSQVQTADALEGFSALRTVSLVFEMPDSSNQNDIMWSRLNDNLDNHRETLQHLSVNLLHDRDEANFGYSRMTRPLAQQVRASWCSLEVLSHLTLHQLVILPHLAYDEPPANLKGIDMAEVLPPGLRHLTIIGATGSLLPHLKSFLSTLPHGFPVLCNVNVREDDFNVGEEWEFNDFINHAHAAKPPSWQGKLWISPCQPSNMGSKMRKGRIARA